MKLTPEEEAFILQRRKFATSEKDVKVEAWQPKPLSSYTDAEKIKHFDRFYGYALEEFHRIENDRCDDPDFDNYMSEAVLLLLGEDVFRTAINKWLA